LPTIATGIRRMPHQKTAREIVVHGRGFSSCRGWKNCFADVEKAYVGKAHSGEGISGTPRRSRHSVVTGEQKVGARKDPFIVTAVRSAAVRTRADARRHARIRAVELCGYYPYRRVRPHPTCRPPASPVRVRYVSRGYRVG